MHKTNDTMRMRLLHATRSRCVHDMTTIVYVLHTSASAVPNGYVQLGKEVTNMHAKPADVKASICTGKRKKQACTVQVNGKNKRASQFTGGRLK